MITLETTSERISAWLRNEERYANGLSALIMSCAIFASALRFRRRRSAPGPAQTRQLNGTSASQRRGNTPPMSTDG
jgi:hypothetical protein